jgi:hypothetical protein
MKFPVFFRILATFNLLGSILLLILLVTVTMSNTGLATISPYLFLPLWFTALWWFAACFAWFFAFRLSFGFLHINLLSNLFMVVLILISAQEVIAERRNDGIGLILVAAIPFIYSLFNLFGIFYKPVKEWVSQSSTNGIWQTHRALWLIALATFILGAASGYPLSRYKPNEKEVTTCTLYYSIENNIANVNGYFPAQVPYNGNIDIPLNNSVCINAIKIPVDETNLFIPWKEVRLRIDSQRDTLITFRKEGGFYVARLNLTCATQFTIYPYGLEKGADYMVASISLVRHYSAFEPEPGDYADIVQLEDAEGDGGYEGDYGTPYDQPQISSGVIPDLVEIAMKKLLENESWNFYKYPDSENGWQSPSGKNLGPFAHGLQYLKDVAAETIGEHLGRESSEYMLSIAVGRDFFFTSPEGSEEPVKFRKVNPEAVSWVAENMLPDPEEMVQSASGYKVTTLYDESFKNMCRLLVETHEYLDHYPVNKETEMQNYENAMNSEGDDNNFYGPSWLRQQYGDVLAEEYPENDDLDPNNAQRPFVFIGFWLRREMDGSASAVWEALGKVMELYDREWYKQAIERWGELGR